MEQATVKILSKNQKIALGVVIVGTIGTLSVLAFNYYARQEKLRKGVEKAKSGEKFTRVVNGVKTKYQVTSTGQIKNLNTGQLDNLVGYKKAGSK